VKDEAVNYAVKQTGVFHEFENFPPDKQSFENDFDIGICLTLVLKFLNPIFFLWIASDAYNLFFHPISFSAQPNLVFRAERVMSHSHIPILWANLRYPDKFG